MLYPFVEFFSGLLAASAAGSAAKTIGAVGTVPFLLYERNESAKLDKLDVNKTRNLGVLVRELERRGLRRPGDKDVVEAATNLRVLNLGAQHPSLKDFAGKWVVTPQEEVLVFFYLGRETAKLGVGAVGRLFDEISQKTGHPKADLVKFFFEVNTDKEDPFLGDDLGAYLRYLKEVTTPARIEWLWEEQKIRA